MRMEMICGALALVLWVDQAVEAAMAAWRNGRFISALWHVAGAVSFGWVAWKLGAAAYAIAGVP